MDAAGEGADLVIPEEVAVWEWAEHAASAYTTLSGQLQEFRVDVALYGRPRLAEELSVESLIDKIKGLLPDSIRVWAAPNAAYKEALVEQVLQIGSGERKGGVKTGAADSLVLACVAEQLERRRGTEAILLATNDKGLRASCANRFADEVLLTGSTTALLQHLNAFQPAEEELYEATEEALRSVVGDWSSGVGAALRTFDMGFRIHSSKRAASEPYGEVPVRDLARIGRVSIVELHDLRVAERDEMARVGLADVRIFADVHMTRLELRETSPGVTEWMTTFDGTVTHGFVDLTLAVTWDRHWDVQSVAPTGGAVIVFDSSEYDDIDGVPPFHSDATGL